MIHFLECILTILCDFFQYVTIMLATKILLEDSIVIDKLAFLAMSLMASTNVIGFIWGDYLLQNGNVLYLIRTVISILVYVAWFLLILRGERKKLFRRIRMFFVSYFIFGIPITMICFTVYYLITKDTVHFSIYEQIVTPSIQVMLLSIFGIFSLYLYLSFYRKNMKIMLGFFERFLLFILSLFTCVLLNSASELSQSEIYWELDIVLRYGLIISSVFLVVCMPLFLITNRKSIYFKKEQENQERLVMMEMEHFRQYRENQEETRRFRHDTINNLVAMQMLMKEEKHEEAYKYLTNLLDRVEALSPKVVTGIDLIDCIVSYKLNVMEEKNIQFQLDGIWDHGLDWEPTDICILFGNALDNAIEACEKVSKEARFIHLSLKRTSNFYMMELKNSIENTTLVKEKNISLPHRYTTKSDRQNHGYGVTNMKNTLEKYHGTIDFSSEEDFFIMHSMIPIAVKEAKE